MAAHAGVGGEYRITCTLCTCDSVFAVLRTGACIRLLAVALVLPILVAHLGLIAAVATGDITTVLLCYFIVYAVHLGVVSSD